MEILDYSPTASGYLTLTLLSGLITLYFLSIRGKSFPTTLLVGFFACLSCLFGGLFLEGIFSYEVETLTGHLKAVSIFSIFFMLQFAYQFPKNYRPLESRIVSGIYFIFLLYLWGKMVFSDSITDAPIALVVQIGLFLIIFIFVRRTINLSEYTGLFSGWIKNHSDPDKSVSRSKHYFATTFSTFAKLIKPVGKEAKSVRAFLLVMLVPIFIIFWSQDFLSEYIEQFRILVLLITIYTFILVYINNSPEPTSISVKLISVTLVTVFLLINILSDIYRSEIKSNFLERQLSDAKISKLAVELNDMSSVPDNVIYILSRPDLDERYIDSYEKIYSREEAFNVDYIIESDSIMLDLALQTLRPDLLRERRNSGINVNSDSLEKALLMNDELIPYELMERLSRWTKYSENVSHKDEFARYFFEAGGKIIETGFLYSEYEKHMKNAYIFFYIIVSVFIFIIFIYPLFFKGSLLKPMDVLLEGVKEVDKGNYEVELPVKSVDEIGIISGTFNKMVNSIKKADQLKDEFLANTSHELRTPLNGIMGLVESIIDDLTLKLPEKIRYNLSLILSSGKRLGNLINDILDFTQLKNKAIILSQKPVDMRQITEVVLTVSEPLKADKDIILHNEISDDLPPVFGDENRLQQIMYNLIGNAIKFTESGTIKVYAEQKDGMIETVIADTGIGIPEDMRERVFESFEQADASTVRNYTGAGLGLSVTKQLVELHGGSIDFESEVNKGSKFKFTIPVSKEKADKTSDLSRLISKIRDTGEPVKIDTKHEFTADSNIKILVVDDEAINLQVLANQLAQLKYETVLAKSGSEALSIIEKGQKPDLIILDIMMPKMSGYEVCKRIREKYSPNELPIIMVTAMNQVSDLVEGLIVGANDYLSKPFAKDELFARIKNHVRLSKINIAFARFVPDEILEFLGKESIVDVKLGDNIQKTMSVLFSDIRSFTSLSEKLTPQENFEFLNSYLKRVGPIIRQNNGFIDKYIGDAIMALFPEKADDALNAAVDTRKEIVVYNLHRKKQGYIPIDIGTGIHTGKLMLGTIGETQRMEGTVISDAVNLASRIEGLTKVYGSTILTTEQTLSQLDDPGKYESRPVGKIRVKGKKDSVQIFDIYEGDPPDIKEKKANTKADFIEGLKHYHNKNIADASGCFRKVLEINDADKAAKRYFDHCEYFLKHGLPEDWDGVESMEHK